MTTAGDLMVIRPKRFELPVWAVVLGLVLRWLGRGCWWCLRHPVQVGLVVVAVTLYRQFGRFGVLFPLVLGSAVSAVWRWRHETSWWRWCAGPLVGWFRRVFVYRRVWREAMTLCGLAETYQHRTVLPQLLRVRSDQALDVLMVRMVRGQTPADFQKVTANLAYAFGRRHAGVYSERPDEAPTRTGQWAWLLRAVDRVRFRDRPTLVYLVVVRTDALRTVVPPFDVPAVPDLTVLPLARREDLGTWSLHLLLFTATRRGAINRRTFDDKSWRPDWPYVTCAATAL